MDGWSGTSVSVPAWLAEQIGRSGRVVASDIDTAWMLADDVGFEVLRHDVGVDAAPVSGQLDLATARLISAWGRKPR